MKFLKPLGMKKASKPISFGQKRAMSMNNALKKAQQERRQLLKKQFLSPDPLNKVYEHKGNQLDARIKKIKDDLS